MLDVLELVVGQLDLLPHGADPAGGPGHPDLVSIIAGGPSQEAAEGDSLEGLESERAGDVVEGEAGQIHEAGSLQLEPVIGPDCKGATRLSPGLIRKS